MGSITTSVGAIGILDVGGPATPLLFLHGVGSDKSVWRPQLDYFAGQRRAIAIDYPGYGESDPRAAATRDDFAQAVVAVLDALGIAAAHVCGLSLGGVVAIAVHALAGERCASLVLADSFAVHPDGAAIHARSVAASRTMTMAELAAARAPLLLGSAATSAMADEIVGTMSRIDPRAYRQGAAAVWLANQVDAAAAIDVPTLVLVGSEDAITPPALSHALAALSGTAAVPRPLVDFVEIADAGHLANFEQPAAFNRALAQFLAKAEADRKS